MTYVIYQEKIDIFGNFKIRVKNKAFYEERWNMISLLTYFTLFYFWAKTKGDSLMARSARLESGFQDKLRDELKDLFPGCMIFKMDQIQGIPDLLILYKNKWASLENKKSANAKRQPNQEYYVDKMNEMSFSRFISPENKEVVLNELQQAFND